MRTRWKSSASDADHETTARWRKEYDASERDRSGLTARSLMPAGGSSVARTVMCGIHATVPFVKYVAKQKCPAAPPVSLLSRTRTVNRSPQSEPIARMSAAKLDE